jgi:hydrogenase/urease accessory protein HupE
MWQRIREYWIPKLLFLATVLMGFCLGTFVVLLPFVHDVLPRRHALLTLFAEDTTVRRSALAAAVGLIVTAIVFFRPNYSSSAKKRSNGKSAVDTMAGA